MSDHLTNPDGTPDLLAIGSALIEAGRADTRAALRAPRCNTLIGYADGGRAQCCMGEGHDGGHLGDGEACGK
jgi:hypothetical protein